MLTSMFKNAPIGILMLTRQGVILDANPFALSLLSYQRDELTGKCLKSLIPYQENNLKESLFPKSLVCQMMEKDDLFAVRKDGKKVPVVIEFDDSPMAGGDVGVAFLSTGAWDRTYTNGLGEKVEDN